MLAMILVTKGVLIASVTGGVILVIIGAGVLIGRSNKKANELTGSVASAFRGRPDPKK